jgi:UV excision repair protein RAD23
LRLSEEEMAAVNRLTEMGFDRAEAAQAYLACDKNEALAANLLMDGGFGGFGGDMGDDGGEGGEGDDDMYD